MSCPILEPEKGHADKSIAEFVAMTNPGISSHVFEYSSSYTLEEYIEGEKF